MKKTIKITSCLITAALLCGSLAGCQNTVTDEALVNYNNAGRIQMDETGGFYLPDGDYYQYIDAKTNAAAPVCGKPDCKHEAMNEECTAVSLRWNADQLYYYQDHLYYTRRLGRFMQTDSAGTNEKE